MVGAPAKPPATPPPPGNKPRPNAPQREADAPRRRPGRLPLALRIFISLWIVWHFIGIFLAALSTNGSSRLVEEVAQDPPMQWYLDALYLNQGHSFFAPDVGPGHAMHYQLVDQSGRVYEDGELPDRKEQWPRLRYHRHLMLADQAQVPSPNRQVADYWQRKYLESYARYLLRVNEYAQAARVRRYAHWPLPRDLEVLGRKRGYEILMQESARENVRMDNQGYELLMDVQQERSSLSPRQEEQSAIRYFERPETANRWIGVPR
jgi:hypothetical protein